MARASRLVAVGMSGGVDSTVAALLLKRKGYSLVGVYMHNWDELDESGQCTSERDFSDVEEICNHISIPCHRVDFVKEYWNEVFSHFVSDIQIGRTPNPDIICNKSIKFNSFYNYTVRDLKAWKIATGHYAQLASSAHTREVQLVQAVDASKDQTYFLSQVPQTVLQRTLFPISHLLKSEVRRIAREAGLSWVADKKESMGLCFVGKRDFTKFISEYLDECLGNFIDLNREIVGRHSGHHLYTIGQRARLGGKEKPFFVSARDVASNEVTVVEGTDHPALFCHSFTTLTPHWISQDPLRGSCDQNEKSCDLGERSHDGHVPKLDCMMRYSHLQPLRKCTIHQISKGRLKVHSDEPMRAVTPGQYAVFYDDQQCLGGACIDAAGPSLWQHKQLIGKLHD